MNKYTKTLIKWTLVAACLAPALGWAHGALDYPKSRAVNCQVTGGFWQSSDGSAIVDKGCRESSIATFNTPAEWAFPAQQWHEIAHIPHINNPTLAQIQNIIKDGKICAANDPKKASLDYPTPWWTKTVIQPGQPLTMRLIGTAPHVPSTFYPFITRPGFNTATDVLKWSDLIPLGQAENFTVANTNWQTPPAISGASGFFLITRPIPSNASGDGLIVGIWVRNDPAGEFFISCSDVAFLGGGVPNPLTSIGAFINADMRAVKPGDSVHFRIFGTDTARKELVDITQPVTSSNLAPGQWGKQIAVQVNASVARIGELNNQTVTFNEVDPLVNTTNVTDPGYTQAMSIIPGGGPAPTPTAEITGPTKLISGQTYTFNGALRNAQNTVQYAWAPILVTSVIDQQKVTGVAPTVGQPSNFTVRLNTRDGSSGPSYQATYAITVEPASSGNYPQYVGGTLYKFGDKVTNNGQNYECTPSDAAAWCTLSVYEPGNPNGHWVNAWKKIP